MKHSVSNVKRLTHMLTGYINSTTHTCCGGIPREKSLQADGSSVNTCCGSALIDTRFQSCCHNIDMTTASPFDRELQKCCGGKAVSGCLNICSESTREMFKLYFLCHVSFC